MLLLSLLYWFNELGSGNLFEDGQIQSPVTTPCCHFWNGHENIDHNQIIWGLVGRHQWGNVYKTLALSYYYPLTFILANFPNMISWIALPYTFDWLMSVHLWFFGTCFIDLLNHSSNNKWKPTMCRHLGNVLGIKTFWLSCYFFCD